MGKIKKLATTKPINNTEFVFNPRRKCIFIFSPILLLWLLKTTKIKTKPKSLWLVSIRKSTGFLPRKIHSETLATIRLNLCKY